MDEYEITSSTIMLEYYDDNKTKVYEFDRDFIINIGLFDIISNSCGFYGSTYEGRLEASKRILGTNIKLPVVVEDIKKIIFFPTKATCKKGSRWISFNNLDRIERIAKNSTLTKLCFCNGLDIDIEISYDIIHRQLFNCLKLEKTLLIRQEKA